MELKEIESLTFVYSQAHDELARFTEDLEAELRKLKRQRRERLKRLVQAAVNSKAALALALADAKDLFDKPRTRIMHGVRVGFMKQRGQIVMDDETTVIKRIREKLPADQAELLIRVRESVHKPAVYDLIAADLKRLGIVINNDEDVPFIKPTAGDIDKLVDALLAEDADDLQDAAA